MSTLHQTLERARSQSAGRARHAAPARFEAEMRALRGQLQPLLDERAPCLLAVTACNHGEGATTISRELARSLALDSVKVLLCGWAAPAPAKVVHPAAGEQSAAGAKPAPTAPPRRMSRTVIPTLCFTDISDLHGEAVRSTAVLAFRDWLTTAKTYFDVVLVDAPPILSQPNWGALLRQQDGVLLAMEAEQTRSIVLATTVSAIETAGGHILGIVFNRRRQYIPDVFYRWL